jgi:hypothetical protein
MQTGTDKSGLNKWVSIGFIGIALALIVFSNFNCSNEQNPSETGTSEACPKGFSSNIDPVQYDPENNNCLTCHNGIEHIRDLRSEMMHEIFEKAAMAGYGDNQCIVCHGGNPEATTAIEAHQGSIQYFLDKQGPKNFYPDPGSPYINANTCGMCHEEQVKTQFTSLMFTEAGKIQGTTWGFGGIQGYNHNVANQPVEELDVHERLGSEIYKKYMDELRAAEPQVFPGKMTALPKAPTSDEVEKDPKLAVYTYLRQDCQRCHTGVKGHNAKGDYRGLGCSSCHSPYSNNGLYEGGDPTIDKSEPGHMLVHSFQASRDAKVKVHDHEYSGVPTKTCTACHNRGRRIGVSYEGLMESGYHSPYMGTGGDQEKIHKKNYIHLQSDVHLKKGMFCQDCHTSGDMHSLGDLSGAIQGAVEIECQDCHGTPDKFPWELPIGYGDEIASESPKQGVARGLADQLPAYLTYGAENEKGDGYLLSARGNPMPHVVKYGDEVILFSASGKDIRFSPLKKKVRDDELSLEGKVAMVQTGRHMEKMECYACHATWAPQCYGCHINIDYTSTEKKLDWVAAASDQRPDGQTAEVLSKNEEESIRNYLIRGKIHEERSYLRWEDPPLVVNGDHRISPAIPGCQTTVTVKGKDGNLLLKNHIFKIKNVEGAGEEGQNAIDMSPVQPHTIQKKARSCESCHTNPKAMGYGIENGALYFKPDSNVVMDLTDASGTVLAKQVDTQFNAIENLENDWSAIIDEEGNQLQTVGHHFTGSRPLNKEELMRLDRRGVCMSCHQTVPDQSIAIDLLSHVAEYGGVEIDNEEHGKILHKSVLFSAWFQVLMGLIGMILAFVLLRKYWIKRRLNRATTRGEKKDDHIE